MRHLLVPVITWDYEWCGAYKATPRLNSSRKFNKEVNQILLWSGGVGKPVVLWFPCTSTCTCTRLFLFFVFFLNILFSYLKAWYLCALSQVFSTVCVYVQHIFRWVFVHSWVWMRAVQTFKKFSLRSENRDQIHYIYIKKAKRVGEPHDFPLSDLTPPHPPHCWAVGTVPDLVCPPCKSKINPVVCSTIKPAAHCAIRSVTHCAIRPALCDKARFTLCNKACCTRCDKACCAQHQKTWQSPPTLFIYLNQ